MKLFSYATQSENKYIFYFQKKLRKYCKCITKILQKYYKNIIFTLHVKKYLQNEIDNIYL